MYALVTEDIEAIIILSYIQSHNIAMFADVSKYLNLFPGYDYIPLAINQINYHTLIYMSNFTLLT